MKIALYFPWLCAKGGIERVILEHVKRSKHTFTIFTNLHEPENTFEEFKHFDVRVVNRINSKKSLFERGIASLKILSTKMNLREYDALLIHTGGAGEVIALKNHSLPILCYCHTPLRIAHDFYEAYARKAPFWQRQFIKLGIRLYKILEKKSWKKLTFVVCNSNNTKQRILRAKLAPESKVTILNPGVDTDKFKTCKFEKYFLALSRVTFYKRFHLLIEAFKMFKMRNKEFKLVIAGSAAEKDKPYLDYLKKLAGDDKDITFASPSEKEAKELFENCYAYLFAAINEDWGIAPIEAMAAGKPVISVNEGGPLESIENGKTGFLVPATPEAFAEKMEKLARNEKLAKQMGAAGKKAAKKYDWKLFAKEFDSLLEKAKEAH